MAEHRISVKTGHPENSQFYTKQKCWGLVTQNVPDCQHVSDKISTYRGKCLPVHPIKASTAMSKISLKEQSGNVCHNQQNNYQMYDEMSMQLINNYDLTYYIYQDSLINSVIIAYVIDLEAARTQLTSC